MQAVAARLRPPSQEGIYGHSEVPLGPQGEGYPFRHLHLIPRDGKCPGHEGPSPLVLARGWSPPLELSPISAVFYLTRKEALFLNFL